METGLVIITVLDLCVGCSLKDPRLEGTPKGLLVFGLLIKNKDKNKGNCLFSDLMGPALSSHSAASTFKPSSKGYSTLAVEDKACPGSQ